MSRLIAASNRVADLSGPAKSGGLAVAMGDALRDLNGIWFGWSGEIVPEGTHMGLNLGPAWISTWTAHNPQSGPETLHIPIDSKTTRGVCKKLKNLHV